MNTSSSFAQANKPALRLHGVDSNSERLPFADVRACPPLLGEFASEYDADKKAAHFYEDDILAVQHALDGESTGNPEVERLCQFFDHCLRSVRERGESRRPVLRLVA